jgi:hypothetical protein
MRTSGACQPRRGRSRSFRVISGDERPGFGKRSYRLRPVDLTAVAATVSKSSRPWKGRRRHTWETWAVAVDAAREAFNVSGVETEVFLLVSGVGECIARPGIRRETWFSAAPFC